MNHPPLPGFRPAVSLIDFIRQVFLINLGPEETRQNAIKCIRCGEDVSRHQAHNMPPLHVSVTVSQSVGAPLYAPANHPQVMVPYLCGLCAQPLQQRAGDSYDVPPPGNIAALERNLKPLAANVLRSNSGLKAVLSILDGSQLQHLVSHCVVLICLQPCEGYLHLMGMPLSGLLTLSTKGKRPNNTSVPGGQQPSTKKGPRVEVAEPMYHLSRKPLLFPYTNGRDGIVDTQWKDLHAPQGPPLPSSSGPQQALTARLALYHQLGFADQYSASEVWGLTDLEGDALMVKDVIGETPPPGPRPRVQVLQSLLDQALSQLMRCNIRGAIIRHLHTPERLNPSDTSQALLPPSKVVGFVKAVCSGLKYRDEGDVLHSLWGTPENLERFCDGVRRWLEYGIPDVGSGNVGSDKPRAHFCARHIIEGMSVKAIPWLKGVCCSHPKARSKQQQGALSAFVHFWVTRVLTPLLRTQFHFTYSPRTPSILCMMLRESWVVLEARETHRLYGLRQVVDDTASPPNMVPTSYVGLRTITKRDVWRRKDVVERALSGAQSRGQTARLRHRNVLYAHIRLLPDGNKLRPIASVRRSAASYLAWYVRRRITLPNQPPRRPPTTTSYIDSGPTPNAGILRDALACFRAGDDVRRREQGIPNPPVGRSHIHEYSELRSFFSQVRQLRATGDGCEVHVVKGDATRCYDSLPQERVKQCILETVPHAHYVRIPLSVATLSYSRGGVREWRRSTRPRMLVMSDEDFTHGVVRGIPLGSIQEEPPTRGYPQWNVATPEALTAQQVIPPQQQQSPALGHPYEVLSGEVVRAVLLGHTVQHLVAVRGSLYKQSIGVLQGSPVALGICDSLYRDVDSRLCDLLSSYTAPNHRGLLLRRVDDILVGTTSDVCAAEVVSTLQKGDACVGFRCGAAKLIQATSANTNHNRSAIPWCGLVINLVDLDVRVGWERLISSRAHLLRRYSPVGSRGDTRISTHRVIGMLQVRLPITVLCGRINSPLRVVTTFCEVCILWAQSFFSELVRCFPQIPMHPADLLRSESVAKTLLLNLVCKKRSTELLRHNSYVPLSHAVAAVCVARCCREVGVRYMPRLFRLARSSGTSGHPSHKLRSMALFSAILDRKAAEVEGKILPGDTPDIATAISEAMARTWIDDV